MREHFDLIVFDWDGTLMDSEAKIVRSFELACADAELPFPGYAAVRSIIGLGLREAVVALFPQHSSHHHDTIEEAYRRQFLADSTPMTFFPGVLDGLAVLERKGYQLAIATGKSRRGLNRLLDEWSLHSRFVATRCADEALSKPHPKMLYDLLASTGVRPERAVMIGDSTYDMAMARNAGVPALAVTYGVHERTALLEHAPIACLDTFDAVRAWLAVD